MANELTFKLPSAPGDEIFKYRYNRAKPETSIWGNERPSDGSGGSISYIPEKIISIQGKGNFVYHHGIPFPSKCFAPQEAIYAIGPVKRKLINTLKLLSSKEARFLLFGVLLMGKKRRTKLLNQFLEHFNQEAGLTLRPYFLENYYCKVVKEIQVFLEVFLKEIGIKAEIANQTAEIGGMALEYDNAYRFPLHDLLNEANAEDLINNFPKEIDRLLRIHNTRTKGAAGSLPAKMEAGAKILKYAWKLPKYKKAIQKALKAMNFKNVKLDMADIYYTLLYADYDTRGLNLEERTRIYLSLYPDQSKMPPRILIRNSKRPEKQ